MRPSLTVTARQSLGRGLSLVHDESDAGRLPSDRIYWTVAATAMTDVTVGGSSELFSDHDYRERVAKWEGMVVGVGDRIASDHCPLEAHRSSASTMATRRQIKDTRAICDGVLEHSTRAKRAVRALNAGPPSGSTHLVASVTWRPVVGAVPVGVNLVLLA